MPRPGAGWIVFPLLVGHLRAAISIASHNGLGAACCRPNRVPDCFLGAAAGNGRQADRVPPRVRIQVDVAHPPALPGLSAAGVPLDQVGARAPGPGGRRRWRRAFRRGRAAWRALGAHGRVRTASRSTRPRPRGRRAAVMRRYPQGSVRGTGLSPDEKGQSASSGSSRRHPARRLVVARPPGTPAHWHISTGRAAVLLAVNGLLPRESLLHPPSRSTPLLFSGSSPHHSWRCGQPGAQPPGSRADSLRKPSSPLGDGMIPAVPAHPAHHSSGPADHCQAATDAIVRPLHPRSHAQPATPSPSEHHALDTVPSCPATRTPGPHCPRNTRHLRAGRRQPQDTARAPRQPQAPLHNRSGNPHSRPRDHIHIRPMNRPPRVGYDHELLDEPPEGRSITSSALFGNNRRARSAACQEVSCSPCGIISLTT